MSESGLVRRVNAGKYLYMQPKSRSGLNRILAKSDSDVQVTVSVEHTEQVDHFESERFWEPVVIDATNDKIDFIGESGGSELNGSVAHGSYDSPHNLALAVRNALHYAHVGTGHQEYLVEWDEESFKFTITHIEESTGLGDYLDILWQTGTHGAAGLDTSCAAALGFDDAADDTGATSYEADNQSGQPVVWAAGPNLVVVARGQKQYDLPVGGLYRLKADVGEAELRFLGEPGFADPPYSQGPKR